MEPKGKGAGSREEWEKSRQERRKEDEKVAAWARAELGNLMPGETKEFPSSLTTFERIVVHRVAEQLGLRSESKDLKPEGGRWVAVTRPLPAVDFPRRWPLL